MTADQIQIGRTYAVRHERILTVLGKTRYLHLAGPWGGRAGYRPSWLCRNEQDGKEVAARSAAAFQFEVQYDAASGHWVRRFTLDQLGPLAYF